MFYLFCSLFFPFFLFSFVSNRLLLSKHILSRKKATSTFSSFIYAYRYLPSSFLSLEPNPTIEKDRHASPYQKKKNRKERGGRPNHIRSTYHLNVGIAARPPIASARSVLSGSYTLPPEPSSLLTTPLILILCAPISPRA